MTLKNWSRRFALACATISLAAGGPLTAQDPAVLPQLAPATAAAKAPAIALIDAADATQWQTWAKEHGWQVLTAAPSGNTAIDPRVQALAAAVQDAIQKGTVDPAHIYLAGRADATAAVFYAISRVPDLWAAGVALGGSPQAAVDSDRIFTANFTIVPVLWVSAGPEDQDLAARLKACGLNIEWRAANGVTNAAVFEWLAKHHRDEFPNEIDCETNSPTFAHCYWIQMTRFDVNQRNDVLPSTRIKAGASAALDLGGFGYKPGDPGPGVLVSFLPEKYSGPLKMGDRIVAIDGRPIDDARQYIELLSKVREESHAVAMVQRGKEKIRMETRIVMPRQDPVVTARVEAQYLPADKEIQIVSRTISEMRVTIAPYWAPDSKLFWNGLALEKIEGPGCLLLTVDKELLHAVKCP
jgi:hypothetical protein